MTDRYSFIHTGSLAGEIITERLNTPLALTVCKIKRRTERNRLEVLIRMAKRCHAPVSRLYKSAKTCSTRLLRLENGESPWGNV